jgi:hypothetical protein
MGPGSAIGHGLSAAPVLALGPALAAGQEAVLATAHSSDWVVAAQAPRSFESLVEGLVQLGVLAVFFGLPILRGILNERKKRAARTAVPVPRRPLDRAPRSEPEQTGKDLWKQLLESLEERAEPRPTAPATPVEPPYRTEVSDGGEPEAAPPWRGPADPLGDPRPPAPAPAYEPPPRRRLTAELPSSDQPPIDEEQLERSGAPVAEAVPLGVLPAAQALPRFVEGVEPPPLPHLEAASRVRRDSLEAPDWRRALVLAEVLAPPLSLRPPQQWGPPSTWPEEFDSVPPPAARPEGPRRG